MQTRSHCTTCPRVLTSQERSQRLTRCEVCRGVRRPAWNTMGWVPIPAVSQVPTRGSSWWVWLDRETLNREVRARFPNDPTGLVMNDKGYFETR